MRLAVLAGMAAAGLVLAACGDDGGEVDTGGTDRGPTTSSAASIELAITVSAGSATVRTGRLTCGDTDSGTGYLAEPAAAEAACDLVRTNREARNRLLLGAPEDRMCTQQYGGPEVAEVVGAIDGTDVNTTIDRTDGCGIADWRMLEPLLGPPGV